VFSYGAERVQSEMPFHADVAETANARSTIVALRTLGMTRSVSWLMTINHRHVGAISKAVRQVLEYCSTNK